MSRTRKIMYVSGTRADFGLMRRTLDTLRHDPAIDLSVAVTGMHLSDAHGRTANEIVAAGFRIVAEIDVATTPATGATMARGVGRMVVELTDAMERIRPDLVLLLGDRGEMLAGAIAAIHMNTPIAHIHGGERSGTVDEPVRHAVSKLSHLHLTATGEARDRLIRMGEDPAWVYVVGAPGLDGLTDIGPHGRAEIAAAYGLDVGRRIALMLFHPVLQRAADASTEVAALVLGLERAGCATLALLPNADAGSDEVRRFLADAAATDRLKTLTHIQRDAFVQLMAGVDVMVGNSSAGIIEAASFGTPVVNVGERQQLRERNANIVDVPADADAIARAVARALEIGRFPRFNIYGDGQTAGRIATLLRDTPLPPSLLAKVNAY